MSERYGQCSPCAGSECFCCDGTGSSGSAVDYIYLQNKEEWERDKPGGWWSLSESSVKIQKMEADFYRIVKRTPALEAAVSALNQHIEKQIQKKRESMNPDQQVLVKHETTSMSLAQRFGFTESQLELIKRTVAKNATDDELELFFYRAKELKLNPLMPGQIYFVKFGNSPGTIMTGIDGFRTHAHGTGKLSGVKRGVVRDKNGVCIGGWADVYRNDWKEPAHEEVALSEYNTGKGNWVKMPETMIKKVAEAAAYRMAFPQQLGGLYVSEEMDKVVKDVDSHVTAPPAIKISQISKDEIENLYVVAKDNGVPTLLELKRLLKEWYGHDKFVDLTPFEYLDFCAGLKETKPVSTSSVVNPDDFQTFEPQLREPGSDLDEPVKVVVKPTSVELPWTKHLPKEDPRMVK